MMSAIWGRPRTCRLLSGHVNGVMGFPGFVLPGDRAVDEIVAGGRARRDRNEELIACAAVFARDFEALLLLPFHDPAGRNFELQSTADVTGRGAADIDDDFDLDGRSKRH